MKPSETLEQVLRQYGQLRHALVSHSTADFWDGMKARDWLERNPSPLDLELTALRAAVELAEAVEGMPACIGSARQKPPPISGIEHHVTDVKLGASGIEEWEVEVWSEFDYYEDGPSWLYRGATPLEALRAAGLTP